MTRSIADLHCDLLSYLQVDSSRTPYDKETRCAVEHLRAGPVKLQTMAIFTETHAGSSDLGLEQAELFKLLPGRYPSDFQQLQGPEQLKPLLNSDRIGILAAIENASSFCEEEEPLSAGLERLLLFFGKIGRPLYISLTWNTENRFGGGADTQVGLKTDGKELLNFLHQKQIAIDLSHASDPLAHDILNYLEAKNLRVSILASHSNARAAVNLPRNLPSEIIQAIVKKKGLIGFNFVRPFVGISPESGFTAHLEEFLKLGAENCLCFGADFFYEEDLPKQSLAKAPEGWFFEGYGDSSCYGKVLDLWGKRLALSESLLAQFAYQNLFHFIDQLWGEAHS